MAISESKYVDINYRIGGQAAVTNRSLSGMLITENELLPADTIATAYNAHDVGAKFGFQSREYKIAQEYFGYIGKNGGRPNKISFCRWNKEDTQPEFIGGKPEKDITKWQNIIAGTLSLRIGAASAELKDLDFSKAKSLSDVAAALNGILGAQDGVFKNSYVVYWQNQQIFSLVLQSNVSGKIEVGNSEIAAMLGFQDGYASEATKGKTITEQLSVIFDTLPGDFGSFAFVTAQEDDVYAEAAKVINSQKSVKYGFFVELSAANGKVTAEKLNQSNGVGGTLTTGADGDFAYLLPMFIAAATDYSQADGALNYMFTLSSYPAAVTTDKEAAEWDALRVNYVGQTQQAGRNVAFYQDGVLFGGNEAPSDMNTFFNELWFQDAMTVALLNLLLVLPKLPANETGLGQARATMQGVIDQAIYNGVISQKAELSDLQKSAIRQQAGEAAIQAIHTIGYWVNLKIADYVSDGAGAEATQNSLKTKKKIVYQVLYKKDDGVSKIEGDDVLI